MKHVDRGNGLIGLFAVIAFAFMTIGAWVTHIVVCIKTASWLLLIAGAFVFPAGIIHGWMIWLGAA